MTVKVELAYPGYFVHIPVEYLKALSRQDSRFWETTILCEHACSLWGNESAYPGYRVKKTSSLDRVRFIERLFQDLEYYIKNFS